MEPPPLRVDGVFFGTESGQQPGRLHRDLRVSHDGHLLLPQQPLQGLEEGLQDWLQAALYF